MATGLMKDEITIDKTVEGETAMNRTIEIDSYRGTDPRQRFRDRSESRDRSRNCSNDSARGRDRNRDGWVQQRSRMLSDDTERSRSRSNSRVSINRDQLRCYRCGE